MQDTYRRGVYGNVLIVESVEGTLRDWLEMFVHREEEQDRPCQIVPSAESSCYEKKSSDQLKAQFD